MLMFRAYLKQMGVVRGRFLTSRCGGWRLWCIIISLAVVTLACNLGQSPAQPTPNRVRIVLLPPATPTTITNEAETNLLKPTPTLSAAATSTLMFLIENKGDKKINQNKKTKTPLTVNKINFRRQEIFTNQLCALFLFLRRK